jgi:hypothetical protein
MLKLSIAALAAVVALTALPADAQQVRRIPEGKGYGNSSESTEQCGSELGYLPRVYAADVAAVTDPNHVWVTVVCADDDMMRSTGNAAYLTPDMKKNKVVDTVLRSAGYFPEDVFAIRKMGDGTLGLFVHNFTKADPAPQMLY